MNKPSTEELLLRDSELLAPEMEEMDLDELTLCLNYEYARVYLPLIEDIMEYRKWLSRAPESETSFRPKFSFTRWLQQHVEQEFPQKRWHEIDIARRLDILRQTKAPVVQKPSAWGRGLKIEPLDDVFIRGEDPVECLAPPPGFDKGFLFSVDFSADPAKQMAVFRDWFKKQTPDRRPKKRKKLDLLFLPDWKDPRGWEQAWAHHPLETFWNVGIDFNSAWEGMERLFKKWFSSARRQAIEKLEPSMVKRLLTEERGGGGRTERAKKAIRSLPAYKQWAFEGKRDIQTLLQRNKAVKESTGMTRSPYNDARQFSRARDYSMAVFVRLSRAWAQKRDPVLPFSNPDFPSPILSHPFLARSLGGSVEGRRFHWDLTAEDFKDFPQFILTLKRRDTPQAKCLFQCLDPIVQRQIDDFDSAAAKRRWKAMRALSRRNFKRSPLEANLQQKGRQLSLRDHQINTLNYGLINSLNRVLRSVMLIEMLPIEMELTPAKRTLSNPKATGQKLMRLNRCILADVFPQYIRKRGRPRDVLFKTVQKFEIPTTHTSSSLFSAHLMASNSY